MSNRSPEEVKLLIDGFLKRWSGIRGSLEQHAIREKRRHNIEKRLIFLLRHSHKKKKIPNPSHVLGKITADARRWGLGRTFGFEKDDD
jgi:hypothetical protein